MGVFLLNVALDAVVLNIIFHVYNYILLSYTNNGILLHPLAPFDLLYSMTRLVFIRLSIIYF